MGQLRKQVWGEDEPLSLGHVAFRSEGCWPFQQSMRRHRQGGGGAQGQVLMEEPFLPGFSLAWVRSVLRAKWAQGFTSCGDRNTRCLTAPASVVHDNGVGLGHGWGCWRDQRENCLL